MHFGRRLTMKFIKTLIEKLYYKAYPDRILDHDIASIRQIEPQKITVHDLYPINLAAAIKIPRGMTEHINEAEEEEFDEFLKHELFREFEPELIKYMIIQRDPPPHPYEYIYRAQIKFYAEIKRR